jgi:hypothetical protein
MIHWKFRLVHLAVAASIVVAAVAGCVDGIASWFGCAW